MAQQKVPASPSVKNTQYELLFGVDYSRDITDVDRRRSPEIVNMISDLGGNPMKRDGFRAVGDKYDGIAFVKDRTLGVRATSSGLTIYHINFIDSTLEEVSEVFVDIPCGQVNKVLGFRQYLIVITNNYILRYNAMTGDVVTQGIVMGTMCQGTIGSSAPSSDEDDIIPTVTISSSPNGTGGVSYYGKNIFSIFQRVSYLSDTKPVYKKDSTGKETDVVDHYEGSKEYIIPAYSKIGTWVKVEQRSSTTGEWVTLDPSKYTLSQATQMTGINLNGVGTSTFTVVEPKITFVNLPPKPVVAGQDNIRITYAPFSVDKMDGVCKGYYNQTLCDILKSVCATIYSQRLIIADGSRTYYSNTSAPLLLDDNQWFDSDNPVMSYTRAGSYLGIITKDTGYNTIYLASEQSQTINAETGEVETYFAIKPSNAGVGAVSAKCEGSLNDEPVFLATTGLYGILSNWQSEKYAVNRTSRINRKLCKEPNLDTAVGLAYNSYFYIAINSQMYVVDSRHRDSSRNGESSYECYYFNGMPNITDFYIIDNKMFFTDGVKLYTWNDDLPETARYYDYAEKDENGVWTGKPVKARWCSVLDDDGAPHLVKTLQKKGSLVTLTPHFNTGAELTLCKDGDTYIYVGEYRASLMTFDRIPFDSFSFESSGQVVDAFMKKKAKKYRRLQIILENNRAEPFGITNVVKVYEVGDLAKPRPAFSKKR